MFPTSKHMRSKVGGGAQGRRKDDQGDKTHFSFFKGVAEMVCQGWIRGAILCSTSKHLSNSMQKPMHTLMSR